MLSWKLIFCAEKLSDVMYRRGAIMTRGGKTLNYKN